jgi:hypothetical protein
MDLWPQLLLLIAGILSGGGYWLTYENNEYGHYACGLVTGILTCLCLGSMAPYLVQSDYAWLLCVIAMALLGLGLEIGFSIAFLVEPETDQISN